MSPPQATDIAATIRPASDVSFDTFTMLVYGPAGSGKTYLAKTAAEAGLKVLLLDCERGKMTLRFSDVEVRAVRNTQDFGAAYKHIASTLGTYDLIVLDSLTEMQQHIVKDEQGDKDKVYLEDWGEIIRRTGSLVRRIRDLPVSVLVTCLSMELGGTEGQAVRIRPSLNGKKLPHDLPGMFDLVAFSHVVDRPGDDGGLEYRLKFAASGEKYCVKDRSGMLAADEPSDFGLIINKVFGREG